MWDKLNIPRAYFGEPTEIKIHHTDRPKPIEPPAYYPDAPAPSKTAERTDFGEPRFKVRNQFLD